VIEEFSNWIEERKEGYKEFLVPDLKLAAFKLVRQKHMKQMLLIKKISAIYNFVEHKDIFLQIIKVYHQKYNNLLYIYTYTFPGYDKRKRI